MILVMAVSYVSFFLLTYTLFCVSSVLLPPALPSEAVSRTMPWFPVVLRINALKLPVRDLLGFHCYQWQIYS